MSPYAAGARVAVDIPAALSLAPFGSNQREAGENGMRRKAGSAWSFRPACRAMAASYAALSAFQAPVSCGYWHSGFGAALLRVKPAIAQALRQVQAIPLP